MHLWGPALALVPESFTPIFHIISSFMRRKRNSRSECALSGPRVGPRWYKKSGRRPPCLTSMVSEATCGAEREVEVVKGNEALEGHATTPTASKEKEDKRLHRYPTTVPSQLCPALKIPENLKSPPRSFSTPRRPSFLVPRVTPTTQEPTLSFPGPRTQHRQPQSQELEG